MNNPTQHLLHRATTKEKLNILCGSTHERQNSNLARTGHNFYAVKLNEHFKKWDSRYGPMPSNYIELPDGQIPSHLSFDVCLIQHIFGQYQALAPIARQLHIPMIRLEHTTYVWNDNGQMAQHSNQMRGNINVFITNHSLPAWQWDDRGDTVVIHHMVDYNTFRPSCVERKNHILIVANDYIGRGNVLGFPMYEKATNNLPTRRVGDTKGFSQPATNLNELITEYQTSKIFLNTAHLSPIPSVMLEAAASECAIVSIDACGISEFFTHGHDAFLVKNEIEMREYLQTLLEDDELAATLGKNARITMMTKCSEKRFINEWNKIFDTLG